MLTFLALMAATVAQPADIRPILREQGFIWPLNGREQIDYVGHIRQGRRDYQIYFYRGVFLPHPGGIDHYVNRLVVMLNATTYLGAYAAPMPATCRVTGQAVHCDTEFPGTIQWTERGPPCEVVFDGDVLRFMFGNWARDETC